jgi:hypothetical protein
MNFAIGSVSDQDLLNPIPDQDLCFLVKSDSDPGFCNSLTEFISVKVFLNA